jgi:predicted nucleic acid-binding protein
MSFSTFSCPTTSFYEASARALEAAASQGSIVICDLVYAELSVHFQTQRQCDESLDETDIRPEPLSRTASFLASRTWRSYRAQGGKRTRILPDFFIGAHAQIQASRLISRDRGFYQTMFPSLVLFDPAAMA